MKHIFTLIFTIILSSIVLAQAPEKISYQFVVRNNNGVLITNTTIEIQISILQFSSNGSAVYKEKHSTMTNINGLANIEIGGGTIISGVFAAIDWSNGPYFLKTETSTNGGSNYTIIGTSQFLSVPYALYAKTAESLAGGLVENDPVYTGSEAANITAGDISNLSNLSGVNTGDQDLSSLATITALRDSTAQVRSEIPAPADGSETILTAGTEINISGDGTGGNPYVIESTAGNNTYHIGDLFGGGIIFYIDQTGEHGLICSMIDLSTSHIWSNVELLIGPTAQSTWNGQANTIAIVNQAGMTSSAAKLCDDYTNADYGTGIFSDWYLPAIAEIELLNNSCYTVNKVVESDGNPLTEVVSLGYYFTSNELDHFHVLKYFIVGGKMEVGYKPEFLSVRAIRSF